MRVLSLSITPMRRILLSLLSVAPLVAMAAPLPRFADNAVWNRNISHAPLATDSATMISTLQGLGGWGHGGVLQIDFSMFVLNADAGAPMAGIVAGSDYYLPDCEEPNTSFKVPLPIGGAIEGSPNNDYTCDNGADDCHLLVVQGNTLYEAYQASKVGSDLQATCALKWDLSKRYPSNGRGEQCTSVDAAGFPVAPLLFNADEVAAAIPTNGDIGHAIRFILPNAYIAAASYVHPASHGTKPPNGSSGPAASLPYGARLRLKANFDMSAYNAAAKVLLRTMQRYGIVLADAGNIALTGEDDRFTTAKWADLAITSKTFVNGVPSPKVTDFEVVESGPRHTVTYECVRNPDDFIFIDGYDY